MNLLGIISIRYSNMSEAEKKIADIILENPQKVADFTVSDLADAAGVSRGSVVNFATSLGYKGYSKLKIDLARQKVEGTNIAATVEADDSRQMFFKVLDNTSSALHYTLDIMANDMKRVADALIKADKIMMFAVAPSAYVAEDICYSFMRIGLPVVFFSEPIIAALQTANLTENSVLIEVSEGGRTTVGLEVAKIVKNVGAKVFSLTSTYESPLYRISDISLVAVDKDPALHLDSCVTRMIYMMIAECICTYITSQMGDEAYNKLGRELAMIEKFRESK